MSGRNVVTGSVIEVSIQGRHNGQRTLNLLHYKINAAPISPTDFTPYAELLIQELVAPTNLIDAYLNCCSDEFRLETIRVQVLSNVRYSYQDFPQTDSIGGVAEEALPPNDGVTITKRNNDTGRHNRGSVHMPAVPRTFVSLGLVTGVGVAAYNLFITELRKIQSITVLTALIELTPCILNKQFIPASVFFDQCTLQLTSRTNRRRTVGVGE